MLSKDDIDEFLIEEVDRYIFKFSSGNTSLVRSSNDLDSLKALYDELLQKNINNELHVIIAIFDYDKNTNIYYYDSEQESC